MDSALAPSSTGSLWACALVQSRGILFYVPALLIVRTAVVFRFHAFTPVHSPYKECNERNRDDKDHVAALYTRTVVSRLWDYCFLVNCNREACAGDDSFGYLYCTQYERFYVRSMRTRYVRHSVPRTR